MKKVLLVSFSNLYSDPRLLRQYEALKNNYEIYTCANKPFEDKQISFYPIYESLPFSAGRKLKRLFQFALRRFDALYWDDNKKRIVSHYQNYTFDLIIANDISSLPLALAIADGTGKVYFDAHEYHPREWEDNLKWNLLYKKFINYLCKTYIPKANLFSTVCESIAVEYEKYTGVRPIVITNASDYYDLKPADTSENKIRIIHHGAAIPSRKMELMIDMMKFLDARFTLDFMLTSLDAGYLESLKRRASGNPKINFPPPVKQNKICSVINQYDIGLFLLPAANFNYRFALPNKIYDFIQARLCIAVSPSPEMAQLVRRYDLGIIAENFSPMAMAQKINALTKEKIMEYKQQAHLHARSLSSEENIKKIRDMAVQLTTV